MSKGNKIMNSGYHYHKTLHGPTALHIALGTGKPYGLLGCNLDSDRLITARMLVERGASVDGVTDIWLCPTRKNSAISKMFGISYRLASRKRRRVLECTAYLLNPYCGHKTPSYHFWLFCEPSWSSIFAEASSAERSGLSPSRRYED